MKYDYLCQSCSHEWVAEQRISDDRLKACPKCDSPDIKRLISVKTGFTLRGKGWFRDGY